MKRHVLVIGGGISGLSAAYYLEQDGATVTLVEKEPRLGGLLETRVVDDCRIEAGPDSFLAAKPAALELIRSLGIESEVIPSNDHQRRTFIWRNNQMIAMPDGLIMMAPTKILPLLATPLLSWGAKLTAGLEYLRRGRHVELPERSIGEFVASHYGAEVVEYLAEPLLTGVFGGDVWKLSANEVLPRFIEMETRYGSVTRGLIAERKEKKGDSLFKSLQGGLGRLVEVLEQKIHAHRIIGVAEKLEQHEGHWRVLVNGEWISADQVVIALRSWQAAALVRSLHGEMAELLDEIPHSSAVTVGLTWDAEGFPHPLNGFGFLVPEVERRNIVACTWVNRKFEHRAPADRVVLRAFLGGDRWCEASDEEIQQAVMMDLRHMMKIEKPPRAVSIARWPRSMPQYEIGHRERINKIREYELQFPGLRLTGNAFEGIGIPDCIRLGKSIVGFLKRSLSTN